MAFNAGLRSMNEAKVRAKTVLSTLGLTQTKRRKRTLLDTSKHVVNVVTC